MAAIVEYSFETFVLKGDEQEWIIFVKIVLYSTEFASQIFNKIFENSPPSGI